MTDKPKATGLDDAQGADGEQTETYDTYDEGAPESATQRSAKSSGGVGGSADEQAAATSGLGMEEAILFAKKYLEDLISFFGLNTDVYATHDEDVIELNVPSSHLNGFLIGQHGETMRALQFLVSSALKSAGYQTTRVNVDIAEYKKQRAERLSKKAEDWLKTVKESGEPMHLEPMNAAERRIIHKLAGEHGLTTISEGEGRERHVILKTPEDK